MLPNSPPADILAIIPAFNEARRIAPVIRGARQHLPVLVVNDGSTDDTAAVARTYGAQLLSLRPNQGKGAALKAGFRRAISDGHAAAITLDADGQHDPAEIPAFLQGYAAGGADLIIGERDFSQIPFIRRLANTLGRLSFSWAAGQPIRDNQSGYRLLSRRMMEASLESDEQGFQFEVETILLCIERGYTLDWVPIRTIYTGGGSHIRPWQHITEFTRMVLMTRRRRG